jgi:hypothetical protein
MLFLKKVDNPQESRTLLFISANEEPIGVGGSWYYPFNAVKDAGTGNASWADYYDLGYNNVCVFASGNQFKFSGGFRYAMFRTWDKAEIYNAVGAVTRDDVNLVNPSGSQTTSPRAAQMQASSGDTSFFVNARNGGSDLITIWKLTDPLGAHTLTSTDVTVTAYTPPPNAVDPGGNSIDCLDARLMNCVVTVSFDTHGTWTMYTGNASDDGGSAARLRMYTFDPFTPSLTGSSSFGLAGQYYAFPTAAAAYDGGAVWSFSRTSPSEFASARYVETEETAPDSHSWGASSQLRAGTGNYTGFRWGDYMGAQNDWGDYWNGSNATRVWFVGEYSRGASGWGTWIGNITVIDTPGSMTVSPAGGYNPTGVQGGPFAPPSMDYTISNVGDGGLNWTVTGVPSWLDVSQEGANLGGGQSDTCTVSTNATADSLAPGIYNATLVFTDCANNGGGSTSRAVRLTVLRRGELRVTPSDGYGTTGPEGGPFVPPSKIYTVENVGDTTVNWTASDGVTYLTTNPASGSLAGGATVDVKISTNATTNTLPAGTYTGDLKFTNTTNGLGNTSRPWRILVTPGPCDPCDANCDGSINTLDIEPFIDVLLGGGGGCDTCTGDVNGDGSVNTLDIEPFIDCLLGP